MGKNISSSGNLKQNKKYDDAEDIEIKNVSMRKDTYFDKYVFCLLIILIGILCATTILILKKPVNNISDNETKIVTTKEKIVVVDNGEIDVNITNDLFKNEDKYIVKNINSIKLESLKNNEDSRIHYNVKYYILNNEFLNDNSSSVSLKFSYSYDGKEWEYINNALRTQESVITPEVGKYYDVSGIVDKLKVSTDAILEAKDGEVTTIYWRCETIFKNNSYKKINKNYKAKLVIEYVDNYF